MTENTITDFHERLGFLGKETKQFFVKLHQLWATGQGGELLKAFGKKNSEIAPATASVAEQVTQKDEAPVLNTVVAPEPVLAKPAAVEVEQPKSKSGILTYLAELRKKVIAGTPLLQQSPAPMPA